jgi:hypothetical protein
MIVFAMIAFGWLALMVLIVSACGAARLGDQSQEGYTVPLSPQPASHTTRRRTRSGALTAPRTPELQRRA